MFTFGILSIGRMLAVKLSFFLRQKCFVFVFFITLTNHPLLPCVLECHPMPQYDASVGVKIYLKKEMHASKNLKVTLVLQHRLQSRLITGWLQAT